MSEKLKPCPFCGRAQGMWGFNNRGQEFSELVPSNHKKECILFCRELIESGCGENLVKKWNTRAKEAYE